VNKVRNQEDRAREIKERHAARLTQYPNVTGVGVGLRLVNGQRTNEVCVRVYVRRKLPEAQLRTTDILPRTLDGVCVDVVEGEFIFLQDDAPPLPLEQRVSRHFPFLPPGVSVGGLRVTAGTLGAAVYDVLGGGQLLLSNWHILCGSPDCVRGEEIVQPGVWDGGAAPKDTVAVLERFAHTDRVDAAVAGVNGQRFLRDAIPGIGLVRGIAGATLSTRVRKSRRTTGVTIGVVDDISADIFVEGQFFRDQIGVVPDDGDVVAAGGDSGSLSR
jgi:endonuclease G